MEIDENELRPFRVSSFVKRILHVMAWMGRGGAETWLMNVLRHIDRKKFQMDFIVQTMEPGHYDSEIRSLGSRLIYLPVNKYRPWTIVKDFKQILKKYGPYDVIHSHVHHFSGFILRLAHHNGIKTRIAHCHNDNSTLRDGAGLSRRFYLALTEHWVKKYATIGLAASRPAASDLFGQAWETDPRWKIHHCGIDFVPFKAAIDREKVRSELDLPKDCFVVGHVGRFVVQKNHTFLVKIFHEIVKYEPEARLLLVSAGPLQQIIKRQIDEAGLSDRVIFAGLRSDVPRLMLGAMDVFLFPSLYEGLGLVLIEAQASGLPCVISDVIPEEADVVKPLVSRLSLSESPSVWAKEVLKMRDRMGFVAQPEALARIEKSSFNISQSVKELESIYSL